MRVMLQTAAMTLLLSVFQVFAAQCQMIPYAPEPQRQSTGDALSGSSIVIAKNCALVRAQSAQALGKRDYADATILLQKAARVCADQPDILGTLAKAEMLSKRFDDSEHTLDTLLAKDPYSVEALMTQGELFYLVGRPSDAIASLEKASTAAPTLAEPHYLLGRVYYQQSSLAMAKAQFDTALRLNPNTYKAYDGLALCYESLGNIGLASKTYMQGIKAAYLAHPQYDVIYADFAELMLRFNSNEKALELAGEAVQRSPQTPRNYLLTGRALEQEGKYQASLRWFLRAAQMDPAYPDPHFQLARTYRKLGDKDKAGQEAALFATLSAQGPQLRR